MAFQEDSLGLFVLFVTFVDNSLFRLIQTYQFFATGLLQLT